MTNRTFRLSARNLWIIPALLILAASPAWARIGAVTSPRVTQGEATLQLRHAYSADNDKPALDNRHRSRFMADYGFTDWFASGIFIDGDRRDGDGMELESIISENRVELTDMQSHGFYSGFRLRYTYHDRDKKPDEAHIRLISGQERGNWDFRMNQIIAHDIGPDSISGLIFDHRMHTTYRYHPDHRMGLETYSDFGNLRLLSGFQQQSHQFGPVFIGKITKQIGYETGYLYGMSDAAPDHSLFFFVSRRF